MGARHTAWFQKYREALAIDDPAERKRATAAVRDEFTDRRSRIGAKYPTPLLWYRVTDEQAEAARAAAAEAVERELEAIGASQ